METKARILAIGDVHGCSRALDALLELVAPRDEDTLVFLGDYIDRGPDSRGVLERLIGLSKRPDFVALRGNHDLWMINARYQKRWFRSWLGAGVGGAETLKSYGAQNLDVIPDSHWKFLESLRPFYETEKFLFTHASLDGNLPLENQSEEWLFWRRASEATPHFSGKTLICGHTSQENGVPLDLGHAICIDTEAYGGGWLSCLDVEALYLYQANQNGETREGGLGDFLL
ncbi:serine/threonine protein phosphatase 1 [Abditibacterium utsteinense]|uniref:Serine/threonine protein phosphatase 1 n=1 Tax=Abditibacterium utsteinense TaxID=1960156 RepID=A0A2S8SU96_9BACT|nr:metallophosphoesterase family protein [Abditibacterium utsteinense]PQV64360.1 serine/threonine protein phosphatase 1 [Abditibacterium utsteinense]